MNDSGVSVPAQDLQAEENVLGALLVTSGMTQVLGELQLAPGHFYREQHRLAFAAMVALHERDVPLDAITVRDELERTGKLEAAGGAAKLSGYASGVAVPGNVMHYGAIVLRKAEWRQRRIGAQLATAAVDEEDPERLAEAQELLQAEVVRDSALVDEEAQREVVWALLEGQAKAEFVWPFDRLNQASSGGMRRGQVNIIAGYTGDGKSQFADQVLDVNGKRWRVALYDNEMTVEERVARRTTRLLGTPHGKLVGGKLTEADKIDIMNRLGTMPAWPMVQVAGWTPDEVAHHIRLHRWDMAVIDILHNFKFHDERELSSAVATFKAAASQANCCIVLVAHIKRINDAGRRRPPNRHDLRWSGDIENLAHTICFVYRRQDTDVSPPEILAEGDVYFDKCRGGVLASVPARFSERRLRWEPRDEEPPPPEEAALVGASDDEKLL